jgi:hypothetical protein
MVSARWEKAMWRNDTVVPGRERSCTDRSFHARKNSDAQIVSVAEAQEAGFKSVGGWGMENDLIRAQRYRALAAQMREVKGESDPRRRKELLSIAEQYKQLADKLIANGEAIRIAADISDDTLTSAS